MPLFSARNKAIVLTVILLVLGFYMVYISMSWVPNNLHCDTEALSQMTRSLTEFKQHCSW